MSLIRVFTIFLIDIRLARGRRYWTFSLLVHTKRNSYNTWVRVDRLTFFRDAVGMWSPCVLGFAYGLTAHFDYEYIIRRWLQSKTLRYTTSILSYDLPINVRRNSPQFTSRTLFNSPKYSWYFYYYISTFYIETHLCPENFLRCNTTNNNPLEISHSTRISVVELARNYIMMFQLN